MLKNLLTNFSSATQKSKIFFCDISTLRIFSGLHLVSKTVGNAVVPWIPEPSTVNNKLKRREGSGSMGRFFDLRFNQRISPLNQSLRDVSIYYLLSKALESRVML